jgi:hypothetical protein
MSDAILLHRTKLLIAALYLELRAQSDNVRGLRVPADPGAFTRAVEQLGSGNKVASEFPILTTLSGPLCHDFQQGLAIAQSAGLISRHSPSFQHFSINLSMREVNTLSTDSRFSDAQLLIKRYLELVLGNSGEDRGISS